MLKYALKMPLSIDVYVVCNSLAMCMDITETYNNMTAFVHVKGRKIHI